MHVIGKAKGIRIHSPEDAYFSYFNSPYTGHAHAAAIDIYPFHQEWGGPVASPVSGKIVRIKKTKMGRKKIFPTETFDYIMAIQPEEADASILRMMHCKPSLKEGEIVDLGDTIGSTIRSRYFNYWTGPHYHVEIMHLDYFSRSTQSYPLELPFSFDSITARESSTEVEFLVETVTEDHIIGYPRNLSITSIGDFCGLSAFNSELKIVGIIDGGLSHYKHGGIIGHTFPIEGSLVGLRNLPAGIIRYPLKGASFFQRGPSLSCFLNDNKLRGISCFIYPKQFKKQGVPQLVLVPKLYRELIGTISEGELCKLKIDSYNNMIKAK
ncbi:MAG: hypothetical protein KAR03_05530 [Candidatus Thorarchaeota archaeon]|nr:hypothetical protein [Candidatus Thorarchaeota archaeon]